MKNEKIEKGQCLQDHLLRQYLIMLVYSTKSSVCMSQLFLNTSFTSAINQKHPDEHFPPTQPAWAGARIALPNEQAFLWHKFTA